MQFPNRKLLTITIEIMLPKVMNVLYPSILAWVLRGIKALGIFKVDGKLVAAQAESPVIIDF